MALHLQKELHNMLCLLPRPLAYYSTNFCFLVHSTLFSPKALQNKDWEMSETVKRL